MYAEHVPAISQAMRETPDQFVRGCMFAILSIRQPVTAVPDQMAVLFDGAEADREGPLFGHKWSAWAFLSDPVKAAQLWRDLLDCDEANKAGAHRGLMALLRVPGLGIVKAGFILQLMGFNVACLDTRNVKREKRNPRAFRTDGKTAAQLEPKVKKYLAVTYGKAAFYWDQWCKDVAKVYDMTAEEVSALHLSIVPTNHVPF